MINLLPLQIFPEVLKFVATMPIGYRNLPLILRLEKIVAHARIDKRYESLIAECDLLIRSGKIHHAIHVISTVPIHQVPRSARKGLAECCRRVGLIGSGLRLLNPVIRREKALEEAAVAPKELCEYSALLARNGAVHEALDLLKSVNTLEAPEALLYLGQCHVLIWEYTEAVINFKAFLNSAGDAYSKLVARVNLIAGHIVLSEIDEAQLLLAETLPLVEAARATRLLANCYELQAQISFWKNDFGKARSMLMQASEIFCRSSSFDQLLVLKAEAIMKSIDEKSIAPLVSFRAVADERGNWEGVREADLFMLTLAPDQKKLNHLVFGSPGASYRRRIEMIAGGLPDQSYILGTDTGSQLNLQTGLGTGIESLPLGKKVHQVITVLTRDFYAPISKMTLYNELYPDEYFDVKTSPFRINQALLRTRHWLDYNKIPARIVENQGTYRFLITGQFGIKIQLSHQSVNPTMARWQQLSEQIVPGIAFTSEDICNKLGWSRTTFRRLAEWACESKKLKRTGSGKNTSYQIITRE